MKFEFATASRIIFGTGSLVTLGKEFSMLGKSALVITGRTIERAELLLNMLSDEKIKVGTFIVDKEPTIQTIINGVKVARDVKCDMVISIGGGSVIDVGKTIAVLLRNPGDIFNYLEVVGKGKAFLKKGVPFVAIPTTAGTGSEVTRNSVITIPEHRVKVSLRSPFMLATLAVVDPELTYTMTPELTAATGLDALTQLIEPFVCNHPNPFVDALCREAIPRISTSLSRAFRNGYDFEARASMSLASLFGGLSLANAKLGAVHGFAGPLGGMFLAPHGMICARLLPFVVEMNIKKLLESEPNSNIINRYQLIAQWFAQDANASINDGIDWLYDIVDELKIPTLKEMGVNEADIPLVIEKSRVSSSMKGNPVLLTEGEMNSILLKAL